MDIHFFAIFNNVESNLKLNITAPEKSYNRNRDRANKEMKMIFDQVHVYSC